MNNRYHFTLGQEALGVLAIMAFLFLALIGIFWPEEVEELTETARSQLELWNMAKEGDIVHTVEGATYVVQDVGVGVLYLAHVITVPATSPLKVTKITKTGNPDYQENISRFLKIGDPVR